MIKCGLYKIINKKTNKFYIGSSKNIPKRWNRHTYDLNNNKHHCIYLQRSWNKHGKENFIIEVVRHCHEKNLKKYEQLLLNNYSLNDLYNVSPCASGGDILSNHPNKNEIIEKMTNTLKEKISNMTELERKKKWGKPGIRNPNYGKRWSKKQRKDASKIKKEYFSVKENRDKLKYKRTEETKKKMSEFAKTRTGDKNPFFGRAHSKETKEKLRGANAGKYKGNQERPVCIDKITYKSVSESARKLGVCPATIIHRIKSKNEKFANYKYKAELVR